MNRKFGAALTACAAVVASQIAFGATAAEAGQGKYMLKNVATGKCLRGAKNAAITMIGMATCNRSDKREWWAPSGNLIIYPAGGTSTSNTCMLVAKGGLATIPDTGHCNSSGYSSTITYDRGSADPIYSPSQRCYVGDYDKTDPYPHCYTRDGKYTQWKWIS